MTEPVETTAPGDASSAQLNLEGNAVPAAAGLEWWTKAWPLFTSQAGMWIAVIVIAIVMVVVVSVIPLLGQLAVVLFGPVIAGGLMLGVREVDRGGVLTIGHIFVGFSNHMGQLVVVGVVSLAGMVVAGVVAGLVAGVGIGIGTMADATGSVLPGAIGVAGLLSVLMMLVLTLPIYMAVWFAPALIVYHGIGAVDAMKASFFGCLKNIVPFFVYGMIGMLLSIVASIPLGLGWLVLGPVAVASVYVGYREIYLGGRADFPAMPRRG